MCNVGKADSFIRFVLGIVLLVIGVVVGVYSGGLLSWILGIVGVVAITTSVMHFCPLYLLIKINTCKS